MTSQITELPLVLPNHTEDVKAIKHAIKELETTLNQIVRSFQDQTGIPILIEAIEPKSQYIGQKPYPIIKVSAFIYDL